MNNLAQNAHFIKGLDPVADFAAGGVSSDVINVSNYHRIAFLVYWGVATGGTANPTFTVQACSNAAAAATTAIPFRSKDCSADAEGALTARAAGGYQPGAGSSKLHLIEVDVADVIAAGYKYVRLTLAETVNDPCVGGIICIPYQPRYGQDVPIAATV